MATSMWTEYRLAPLARLQEEMAKQPLTPLAPANVTKPISGTA